MLVIFNGYGPFPILTVPNDNCGNTRTYGLVDLLIYLVSSSQFRYVICLPSRRGSIIQLE